MAFRREGGKQWQDEALCRLSWPLWRQILVPMFLILCFLILMVGLEGFCSQASFSPTMNYQMVKKIVDPCPKDVCVPVLVRIPKELGSQSAGSKALPINCSTSLDYKFGARCPKGLKKDVIQELEQYFSGLGIGSGSTNFEHWPDSVAARWMNLNRNKSPYELGVLSWNTNGRLNLRGCRESLLRRWSTKGFVDLGLIQEHFKKECTPLFNLFGPAWWNLSSGAMGESRGRRSGGCAIFGQPCLVTDHGFEEKGGRICGLFTSDGLFLSVYFPTKGSNQSMEGYRESYTKFVDDLINVVEGSIAGHPVAWIVCGSDLNAHFEGCGIPPRRKDDYAAKQVRRFMLRFKLVSLSLEMSPNRFTCMNSRGNASCIDTFLISKTLYDSGAVTMFEVLDFFEHGSDHSPVYVRLKVHPSWKSSSKLPRRRILKSSGFKSLRKRLSEDSRTKQNLIMKIQRAFLHVEWSKAKTRKDINNLWCLWLRSYESLVEEIIGTRLARVSSWGRKFDTNIRNLCKKASIARSWFVETKRERGDVDMFFVRWKQSREAYIEAWEKAERDWNQECVERAVAEGDISVWRLLSNNWKKASRSLVNDEGCILTDPVLIESELLKFHRSSNNENSSVPPGAFDAVKWKEPFRKGDEVLEIPDQLVANCIMALKNSAGPDNMSPKVIKLIFGSYDRVNPVGELIRAVARTRVFPDGGKIARQIFCWKGVGMRNKLKNCRTITMSNVLLKLAESCIKNAALEFWKSTGFPRAYWGHFFGAPESIYIWQSTVERYARLNMNPETALTDVSRAFDRVHHGLFKRKLVDLGLPRQLIELIIEFISDIKVCLCWGESRTDLVDRGNTGVPQGSMEGMWNFGVYSDNILDEISASVEGISLGNETIRAVVYADDISPINSTPALTNLALKAVSKAGTFNAYKFKPSKYKIIGSTASNRTEYTLGDRTIQRAESGLLLGTVIDQRGIDVEQHIRRRATMVW